MRGIISYLLFDVPLLSDPLFRSFLETEPPDLTSLSTLRFWELTFIFDFLAVLAVSPLISRLDTLSVAGENDRWFVLVFWPKERLETVLSGDVDTDLRDTPEFWSCFLLLKLLS
jgi:hypothetical protein